MEQYRKKPIVVEAIQCTQENFSQILRLISLLAINNNNNNSLYIEENILKINTLEGTMICNEGDWLIRGVNGEYYPCKDEIFKKTYEKVESEVLPCYIGDSLTTLVLLPL